MNDWSDEEADNPLYADDRNFYKSRNGPKMARRSIACCMPLDKVGHFYEGDKAPARIRLTIRQQTRVLDQWPQADQWFPNDPRPQVWTGKWPGEEDCERLNFSVNGDPDFPI